MKMKKTTKVRIRLAGMILLAGILLCGTASAELSTNLRVVTELNPRNSKPALETFTDEEGNPVVAEDKGYASIRYTYASGNRVATIELLDAQGEPVNGRDGYARIERKYSDKIMTEQCYYNTAGELVNGPEGYARKVTKKSHGKWLTMWEYDAEGNPVNNHQMIEYYPDGKIKTESWYDVNDQLTAGPNGYARREAAYKGRILSNDAYFDAQEKPFYYAKVGYARMEREYDNGREIALRYYGINDELIPGPEGYAYALYSYRNNGQNKRAMYYNEDGSPYFTKDGYCGVERVKGTKRKLVTEEYYFTGEDQRGRCNDGYSGVLREYNNAGIVRSVKYVDENDQPMNVEKLGYCRIIYTLVNYKYYAFAEYQDADRKPVLNADGYAAIKYIYDGITLTGMIYLDTDNATPINCKAGYAKVTYERDENGNAIRTCWFDADGQPVAGDTGAEEVRNEWSGKLKTRESYWNADGNPAEGTEGVHEIRYEYNGAGKVIRKSYYSASGRPTAGKDGYAIVETEYNSNGGIVSTRYYDTAGMLMKAPGKEYAYERVMLTTDLEMLAEGGEADEETEEEETEEEAEEEKETEESASEAESGEETAEGEEQHHSAIVEYYGTDGKLMNLTAGYARIVRKANSAGKITEESYFSADGQPVTLKAGYATVRRDYDTNGALCREAYYGADGEEATLPAGYHYFTRTNDYKGNALSQAYFDTEGKPVMNQTAKYHRVDKTYLDAKHVLSEAWFDTEGRHTAPGDTFVAIERRFDNQGNMVAEITFDAQGKPIARKDGYDESRTMYNSLNQAIQVTYYKDGELTENAGGVAIIQREYNEEGLVAAEWYLDRECTATINGETQYHRVEMTYLDPKHITSEAWFDPWEAPMTTGDTYVKVEREYDDRGNLTAEKYFGPDGKPIAREAGYDEMRQTFDEENRVIRIEYLLDGQPVLNNSGVAVIERTYGEDGFVAVEAYFGTAGEPVLNTNQVHRIERTYLDAKHIRSEAWFDTAGQPASPGEENYVKVEREFDEQGNTIRETYYGPDGKPIARKAGYDEMRQAFDEENQIIRFAYYLDGQPVLIDTGIAVIERTYGADGLTASEAYYGTAGEPVMNNGKYHRIDRTWLDAKHATSEAWFDTDDKPMTTGDTYVKIEKDFDGRGNPIEERYYGPDGQLIPCKAGYTTLRREYNAENQAIRFRYYLDGEPFTLTQGYAVMEREYDGAGNVTAERYYDSEENPVVCASGYAEVRREYNEKKKVTKEAWFDLWGAPMTSGDTYVSVVRDYDDRGNLTTETYYGADGKPIARVAGYDEMRQTFDEENRVVRIEYYLNGQPVLNNNGVAAIGRTYGEDGFVAVECYYGTAGEPVLNMNYVHKVEREYQDAKHIRSEAWFDTVGQPACPGEETYAKVERKFDERGNTIRETYYGPDGKPIARKAGYDEMRQAFDEENRAIRTEYYLDGQPVLIDTGIAVIERSYGADGLVASESYYGPAGEPVAHGKNKYHRIDRTWRDAKHATSEAWFDTKDEPMKNGDTYVKIIRVFDEHGNTTEERYYGADGKPIACKSGYDTLKKEYNEANQVSRFEYYLNGEPYTLKKGYAAMEREYDDRGNAATERYYDGEGKPTACSGGYAEVRKEYNEKKQVVREAWFDTEGKPTSRSDTYSIILREYDENGNVSVETYLDEDGKPIACKAGYERIWKRYNEKKQVIYESYFGHDNTPMVNKKGVYQTTYDYNEQGKVIQEQYFDAQGQPMLCKDGYFKVIRTYGEDGKVASEEYMLIDGSIKE